MTIILALAGLAVSIAFLALMCCCALGCGNGSTWRPATEPNGAAELTSYRLQAFVVRNGGNVTLLPCGRPATNFSEQTKVRGVLESGGIPEAGTPSPQAC